MRQVRLSYECPFCEEVMDLTEAQEIAHQSMGFVMEEELRMLSEPVKFECDKCGREAQVNLPYMHIREDDECLIFSVACRDCDHVQEVTDDVPEEVQVLMLRKREHYLEDIELGGGVYCEECGDCYGVYELIDEVFCPEGHDISLELQDFEDDDNE